MTGNIKIYGASDDLIEIEGDISEEFGDFDTDKHPGCIAFADGTILRIQYGINDEGIWRITPLCVPATTIISHEICVSEDADPYSDVVAITTPEPLRCVIYGNQIALTGPGEPIGYTRISGKGGHIIIDGDCPARFDVDSYETEIHVDLAYIYVDVWNRSLKLGIVVYADDGWHARVRLVDPTDLGRQTDLDISIADLEEAVWDAGGSIDCSGKYPLNATLRERLGAVIEQPVVVRCASYQVVEV